MWVPGIKLRTSDFHRNCLYPQNHLISHKISLILKKRFVSPWQPGDPPKLYHALALAFQCQVLTQTFTSLLLWLWLLGDAFLYQGTHPQCIEFKYSIQLLFFKDEEELMDENFVGKHTINKFTSFCFVDWLTAVLGTEPRAFLQASTDLHSQH